MKEKKRYAYERNTARETRGENATTVYEIMDHGFGSGVLIATCTKLRDAVLIVQALNELDRDYPEAA